MALNRKGEELEKRFKATLDGEFPFLPYYHISAFEDKPYPVILPHRGILPAQWGLVPHWVKEQSQAEDIRRKTINARWETLEEKPSFREAVNTPVLVPVTGFYEYKTQGKKKIPHHIHLQDQQLFCLGGIASQWPPGDGLWTFTIITRPAEEPIASLHHRMPLLLSPEGEEEWLQDGRNTLHRLKSGPSDLTVPLESLRIDPVEKLTNSPVVRQRTLWD